MGWTPPAVGQHGTWTRTFETADVEAFAGLTGDRNPLPFDPGFAAATRAGDLIVQGGLTTGLLLTAVTILVLGLVDISDGGAWRVAFIVLALGPAIGIAAMWRLRQRPEAVRMAGGHR